jgi:hypothetical protein
MKDGELWDVLMFTSDGKRRSWALEHVHAIEVATRKLLNALYREEDSADMRDRVPLTAPARKEWDGIAETRIEERKRAELEFTHILAGGYEEKPR